MDDSSDLFPIGMRILAVDHDPTCLQVLETLLRTYQYHVTTTNQAITALAMLQENTDKFDLVIIDVHIPDMDGFKLLELVRLEMNLPVIMLSACGDTKLLMKGISHGACDFLLKPVRLEELKNIWQNVIRRENSGFVWSVELHRKFVTAVNHLGIDKSVPKKVLHMMNVENITRENVASHLQKYRLYLKRISCIANHKGTSMVPALGSADQSYLRMDGSEHFHGNAFRSFSPSGIISNLNPVSQNILQSMPMSIGFDHLQNNNDVISVQNLNNKFCDSLQMKPDGFAELTECSSSRQPCVDIVSQQQISNNLSSLEYMASSMMEQVITYVKINDCFSIDDDYVGCVGWEAWLKLLCW